MGKYARRSLPASPSSRRWSWPNSDPGSFRRWWDRWRSNNRNRAGAGAGIDPGESSIAPESQKNRNRRCYPEMATAVVSLEDPPVRVDQQSLAHPPWREQKKAAEPAPLLQVRRKSAATQQNQSDS